MASYLVVLVHPLEIALLNQLLCLFKAQANAVIEIAEPDDSILTYQQGSRI